jgi:DNA-binding NtrC family response regulator
MEYRVGTQDNILLIDDDRELRDLVGEELERRGYGVLGFASAEEARSRLEDPDIGVVLTHVDMGAGMPGIELCESVAAIREDLAVVETTGFGTVETAIAAIRAGAYDFVVKPFETDAIVRVVDRALKLHALRAEVRALRREMSGACAIPNLAFPPADGQFC